ncbi:LysR family transcriptional regulator [Streptomyces sp. PTM05]|uniref:LysR family transcriptional regulator n=1 Tax=Streptantibioticus parmotrematis TaxID=2873249 RepID=A0ABS7QUE6_9ACTN|nr:LysR family transcriptional regulator [Streptantibioticus parmotrematis]MBY8886812.1 LysR family transcriptional regulator [Streptantibioticus parmotrematis]
MELEPRRLVVLCAVARAGGIAAAARLLDLTPSAVSQAVRKLEDAAGVPLLDRSGGRAELTVVGARLAERGARIADEVAAAERDLTGTGDGPRGPVAVGATAAVLSSLAARAVAQASVRHPGLRPALKEVSGAEGLREVRRGTLDLAVLTCDGEHRPEPPDGCGLSVLFRDQYRLGVPAAWPQPAPDDPASLGDLPWITAPEDSARGRARARLAARHGWGPPPVAHEAATWSAVSAMTAAGLGAVVLPTAVASRTPGLRILPAEVPGRYEAVVVHRTTPSGPPPPVLAVMGTLAATVAGVAEELFDAGLLEVEPTVFRTLD